MHLPFQSLLLLALLAVQCEAQPATMNEISKNGMTLSWKIEGEYLHMRMSAPTGGWLAIGFNSSDELAGTNLIMACVVDGKPTLSDRYITAPGKHDSIMDLGGLAAVQLISGTETDNTTSIEFMLPLKAADQWHHDLVIGKKYSVLMAFSREDDFAHHSMMRTNAQFSL